MAIAESPNAFVSHRGPAVFAGRDHHSTVIRLHGEHDMSTVAALSETLARAIALDDSDLVLDMSDVGFMSAATIGVIMRAQEFLDLRSRSLSVRAPSRSVKRVIDVCGLSYLTELVAPSSQG